MKEIKAAEAQVTELPLTPEAIQAQYDAMVSARAAKEAARAQKRKTEQQLQAIRDAEALDRLEAEHGEDLAMVETDRGLIILKRSTQAAYRALQAAISKPDKRTDDWVHFRNFVGPCVLHPETAAFDLLLTEEPVVLFRCATAITGLLGAAQEDAAKK